MKKALLTGVLIAGLSSTVKAETKFYAGLNYNAFSVSGKNLTSTSDLKDTSSSDNGYAAGLNLGLYLDETKRVNFQHFRGDDSDSSIFTADMTSLAFDYVFNSANPHSGFFLGAGFTYIRIESGGTPSKGKTVFSKVSNSTNFLFRAGYSHKFENNIMLELGLNKTIAETEHKFDEFSEGKVTKSVRGDFTVNSAYLGVNYVF